MKSRAFVLAFVMHPFLQRYGDAKRSTYILWFSDPESADVAKGARGSIRSRRHKADDWVTGDADS
jgi:hypothetical protein